MTGLNTQPMARSLSLNLSSAWHWRQAQLQDVVQLASLAASDPWPAWNAAQLSQAIRSNYQFEMWMEGGQLQGFYILDARCSEMQLLYLLLAPRWRGQGLGRKLLQRATSYAQTHAATQLQLELRAANQVALCLYQSAGFELVGRRRAYYQHTKQGVDDALLMTYSFAAHVSG